MEAALDGHRYSNAPAARQSGWSIPDTRLRGHRPMSLIVIILIILLVLALFGYIGFGRRR